MEAEDCTFSSAGLAYAKAYSSIFDTLEAANCGVVLSHLLGVGQEDMENRLIFKDNAVEGTFRYSYDLLGISEDFYPRGDRHGKSGVDFYNLGPISEKIRWEPL